MQKSLLSLKRSIWSIPRVSTSSPKVHFCNFALDFPLHFVPKVHSDITLFSFHLSFRYVGTLCVLFLQSLPSRPLRIFHEWITGGQRTTSHHSPVLLAYSLLFSTASKLELKFSFSSDVVQETKVKHHHQLFLQEGSWQSSTLMTKSIDLERRNSADQNASPGGFFSVQNYGLILTVTLSSSNSDCSWPNHWRTGPSRWKQRLGRRWKIFKTILKMFS